MGVYIYGRTSVVRKLPTTDGGEAVINQMDYMCKPYWDLFNACEDYLDESFKEMDASYHMEHYEKDSAKFYRRSIRRAKCNLLKQQCMGDISKHVVFGDIGLGSYVHYEENAVAYEDDISWPHRNKAVGDIVKIGRKYGIEWRKEDEHKTTSSNNL